MARELFSGWLVLVMVMREKGAVAVERGSEDVLEDQFRLNQLWNWFQLTGPRLNELLLDHANCQRRGTSQAGDDNLEENIKHLQDKLAQLEIAMDVLTRRQMSHIQQTLHQAQPSAQAQAVTISLTQQPTTRAERREEETETVALSTSTIPPQTTSYPPIECPGRGFYQVEVLYFRTSVF